MLVLHVADEVLDAFFGELDLVLLLVNDKEEFRIGLVHLALVVREVIALGLEELLAHAILAEELDEGLALGQCTVRAVQGQTTFLHLFLGRAVHQLRFASAKNPWAAFCCTWTKLTTLGLSWSNSCSSPLGVGPLMMSGVRASSMRTESTSSTMAKLLALHELLRRMAMLSRR